MLIDPVTGTVAAISGFVVVDMTIRFFSWRSNRKKFKEMKEEIEELRVEVRILREEINSMKNIMKDKSKTVSFSQLQLPMSRGQSTSSTSEYFDATEEWLSGLSSPREDEEPLLPSRNERGISNEAVSFDSSFEFAKLDSLHEKNQSEECYKILKGIYDSDPGAKENIEVLWRLARACRSIASGLPAKDPRRKELLLEGQKYAQAAYKIDSNNFYVLKWCAVTTGGVTDYLGTKEKIQQGYEFKEYLDKALAMQTEYSLYHMRGRFSFSVANLSWFERKAASTFFATPPTATIDDALQDFLEVEKLRPNSWIENLVFIARCYIAKGDKSAAAGYLQSALNIQPDDDAEKELQEEAKDLLKKCK